MTLQPFQPANWRDYRKAYDRTEFWMPYVEEVARRHRLEGPIARIDADATNPVFAVGSETIVKLNGEESLGYSAGDLELEALRSLEGLPVPRVRASGQLFPGAAAPWSYMVLGRVPGGPLDEDWDRLSRAEQERISEHVGEVLRAIHARPVPDRVRATRGSWRRQAAWRRNGIRARHAHWGILAPHLIEQIEEYVDAHRPVANPESLVHADLDGSHLFGVREGDRWRLSAVIDYADAMPGPPAYDAVTLHFELFRGDLGLFRRLGLETNPTEMMALTLLHNYEAMDALKGDPALEARSLDELASRLFGV